MTTLVNDVNQIRLVESGDQITVTQSVVKVSLDVGNSGPQGPAGTTLTAGGAWTAQAYARDTLVSYQGSSYASSAATLATDIPGTSSKWTLLASKGDTGQQGLKGDTGAAGRSVSSITRTSGTGAPGTTDTFTITYSDSTTSTFQVYNGSNGTNGLNGSNGRGVTSVTKTGTVGLVDTYTITYSDSTTSTFTLTNGAQGAQGPQPVFQTSTGNTASQLTPGSTPTVAISGSGTAASPYALALGIPKGAPAGSLFYFSTATTGTPSSSYFRFNSSTLSSVTQVVISDSGITSGNSITGWLNSLSASTNGVLGYMVMMSAAINADAYNQVFAITGIAQNTPATNYWTLTGSQISGNSSNFAVNDKVSVSFVRNGDTGAAGSSGVASAISPLAYDAPSKTVSISTNISGGVPTLDGSGKIASSQLPALAISSVTQYASTTALYADSSNQQEGDVGVVTADPGKGSYIRNATTYTGSNGSACWVLLTAPTDVVTSVNSQTGTVVLDKTSVGLANVDNTSDANKPISTATQTALNGKSDTTHTHSVTGDATGTLGNGLTAITLASTGTPGAQQPKVTTDPQGRVISSAALAASDIPNLDGGKITTGTVDTARLNAASSTDTAASKVVVASDTRLSDGRPPDYVDLNWNTDANYTLSATKSTIVQQTATLTAPRTITLPAANSLPAGSEIIIQAGGSLTSSNTVTINRAGSDTINGGTTGLTVSTAYGMRRLLTDGASAWTYDAGVLRISNALSELSTNQLTARTNLGLGNVDNTSDASKFSSYASSTTPNVDSGTGSIGTSTSFARADHVHPTDATRLSATAAAGGDLTGNYPNPTIKTNVGLSGAPTAPTAAADTNTTQIASTAFVVGQAGSANPQIAGTPAPGTSLRYSRQDHVHPTDTTRAPALNPTFTGTVTTPLGSGVVHSSAGGVLSSSGVVNADIASGSNISPSKMQAAQVTLIPSAAFSLVTATTTLIALDTLYSQTGETGLLSYTLGSYTNPGGTSPTHTSAGYITVNQTCVVEASAMIWWANAASGSRAMFIKQDAGTNQVVRVGSSCMPNAPIAQNVVHTLLQCQSGDRIYIQAQQNSGGNLAMNGGGTTSYPTSSPFNYGASMFLRVAVVGL